MRIAFCGDIILGARGTRQLLNLPPEEIWGPVQDVAGKVDFWVANLETPCCTHRRPASHKKVLFRTPPEALEKLHELGIRVVSLANNHAMDMGRIGLLETIQSAHSNSIQTVGAGRNIHEALCTVTVEDVNGKVGFISASTSGMPASMSSAGVAPVHTGLLIRAIESLKSKGAAAIVLMHGGVEYLRFPTPNQQRLYRTLTDAGADLVIGTHPHVIQAPEIRGENLIVYSLGNFIFDWVKGEHLRRTRLGLVLVCTILHGKLVTDDIAFILVEIGTDGRPIPVGTPLSLSELAERYGYPEWKTDNKIFRRASSVVRKYHVANACSFWFSTDIGSMVLHLLNKGLRRLALASKGTNVSSSVKSPIVVKL